MRLGDVSIGQRYWLNGKQYLRINDEIFECFINKSFRENFAASIDLEYYRVMCHDKDCEVSL